LLAVTLWGKIMHWTPTQSSWWRSAQDIAMTTEKRPLIADDYASIKRRMEQLDHDRRMAMVAVVELPDNVIIVLVHQTRNLVVPNHPQSRVLHCALYEIEGVLLLMKTRAIDTFSSGDGAAFYIYLKDHFPSAKLRSSSEVLLSPEDSRRLADLVRLKASRV
jgi:hypothetical protein